MIENDGGPAFPHDLQLKDGVEIPIAAGMSLRDYFAAQGMSMAATMLSARGLPAGHDAGVLLAAVAEISYAIADAMLKERAK